MPTTFALPVIIVCAVLLILFGVRLIRALDDFRDARHAANYGSRSSFGHKASKLFIVIVLSLGTILCACGLIAGILSVLS